MNCGVRTLEDDDLGGERDGRLDLPGNIVVDPRIFDAFMRQFPKAATPEQAEPPLVERVEKLLKQRRYADALARVEGRMLRCDTNELRELRDMVLRANTSAMPALNGIRVNSAEIG